MCISKIGNLKSCENLKQKLNWGAVDYQDLLRLKIFVKRINSCERSGNQNFFGENFFGDLVIWEKEELNFGESVKEVQQDQEELFEVLEINKQELLLMDSILDLLEQIQRWGEIKNRIISVKIFTGGAWFLLEDLLNTQFYSLFNFDTQLVVQVDGLNLIDQEKEKKIFFQEEQKKIQFYQEQQKIQFQQEQKKSEQMFADWEVKSISFLLEEKQYDQQRFYVEEQFQFYDGSEQQQFQVEENNKIPQNLNFQETFQQNHELVCKEEIDLSQGNQIQQLSEQSKVYLSSSQNTEESSGSEFLIQKRSELKKKRIDKNGRNTEKTVREAMLLVQEYENKCLTNKRLTKENAAIQMGQKKKTLDDYKLQIKIAKYLKFDFETNSQEGMGKLRAFNENEIKRNKIERKKMIITIASLNQSENTIIK